MSFYKIHTPVAIAAWDAMHQADAELRKQGTAFAELFVARPVFKNDVTSTSFHGIRFHGTTYVSESLWTQPTSNNGFCSWPKSKAPRGMSAEHKALMEIWNSNRPKKSVDVSAFYPAIGLDWEILFMTGFAMFRHTDTIYIETDAKPKSDAGAVEILGSEYNAAKQFSATLKLTPIATGRHRARFSWINRRCVMPANELKPTLADWLESGEYLPEFMRDFHDQKDVFKAMHHIIKNADEHAGCWADVPARLRALTAPPAPAVEDGSARQEAEHVASILELIGSFEADDIDGDTVDLRFELDGVDTGSDASITEYASRGSAVINQLLRILATQPVSSGYKLPDNVREALALALQAMEFMGDTLNNIDAVCTEDVEYVTPAFTAVRGLLAAAPEGSNG